MSQYTTYSRSILSDFKKIVELLQKHSSSNRGLTVEFDPQVTALPIIPANLMNEALADPQNHFLQFIIRGFGAYAKAHKELYEQRKAASDLVATINSLQQQIKSRSNDVDEATQSRLKMTLESLAHHQKVLNALTVAISDQREQLTSKLKKLTEMAERQDKAWDAFRAEGVQTLLRRFNEISFDINENEKAMLNVPDNWAALLKRRQELNIQLPKSINIDQPSFSSYFQLKCYIAIHSSLSRRMLGNSTSEVQKIYDQL